MQNTIVENKPRRAFKRVKKPLGRAKLIKLADTLYSLFVRQKYANKEGVVKCYTCPYQNHWKRMQNGHYISRFFKYTRWDLNNMRPQCFMCNMRLGGCAHIFRENLVSEIGEDEVKMMEIRAKSLFREPDSWIQAKINEIVENPLA